MKTRYSSALPRRLFLLAALIAFPLALAAQTPCEDGEANEYECQDIDLLGHLSLAELGYSGESGNDIWGWTDPDTGKEYALMGTTGGTAFVDVSTPTDPVVVGTLDTECSFGWTWRDMKVYDNHAFIVSDDCNHGMQVFDLTRLRDVTNPPETFDTDAHYSGGLGNTHNIVGFEEAELMIPVGSNTCGAGLEMLDVSDPLNPTSVGCYADEQNSYVHDAQCVQYEGPDEDYIGNDICFTSSEDFLAIIDVTDPSSPALINRAFYPEESYTHQGWLSEDGMTFILNDETTTTSGGTRSFFFDVEDLDNPEHLFTNLGTEETTAHNLYIRDNYAYLSNYQSGLRIWDVETPQDEESLEEIAYFDTYPSGNSSGYDGAWSNYPFFNSGIVIVSDINRGLFVLEPTFFPVADGPTPDVPGELLVQLSGPNPTDGETSLAVTSPTDQKLIVELFDMQGRRLRTVAAPFVTVGAKTSVLVDVHDLSAGTYFLRVQGEQEIVTKRIAVVR